MAEPIVSVVVPCYNGGRFLHAMLGSLAAQTFRGFEIIIVNDGSNEPETLRVLHSLPTDVQVIHQENRHLSGARNTGFRAARGEFVLPLDADDMLAPDFLSETVAALRAASPEVGFVFTHIQLTGSLQGQIRGYFDRFDQLFLNRLPYCMLMRRSAWETIGGYDEAMRRGMEDWEFNIRLAAAGYRGIAIPKPLFLYTVRSDGMLLSQSARMQGTVWRQIRSKHRDLYRLPALALLLREKSRGVRSTLSAACLLGAAKVLPDAWFDALFFRLMMTVRAARIRRGHLGSPGANA
ncbi:glycosyltransferase family A protein [Pseudorhodoplanes sp.]|uniref:glycosyltransferase family 2 protein n=1 Tax=Pseudorhodoplanes sp. TaxID=1934341 RepID=UPI002B87C6A7|nr:glycosyltransferase family A protein [Pseudorhodoplanes sp.]HWV40178.1 glycosyltransferase family A protein [Pseudorhodoplanes sp.]